MNTEKLILKELNQRKSVRGFLSKEIEPEKLDALWAAAQWAPSCANKQDWHYYAVVGVAREKLADILNPGNYWALKAPLVLCVTYNAAVEAQPETRKYGMYDTALSVMSLVIEAEHQGLRARQMAGFKEEPFRTILHIPENEHPAVIIAVGYEEKFEDMDADLQEKDKQPRTRKSIDEVVTIIENL